MEYQFSKETIEEMKHKTINISLTDIEAATLGNMLTVHIVDLPASEYTKCLQSIIDKINIHFPK